MLLELVIRQKPFQVRTTEEGFKDNLVDWVNHLSDSGRTKDAIDKAICGRGHDEEILQFLRIACNLGCFSAQGQMFYLPGLPSIKRHGPKTMVPLHWMITILRRFVAKKKIHAY